MRYRRAIRRLLSVVCAIGAFACNRSGEGTSDADPAPIGRGDDVVVERSAAVFSEGRVLSVEGDRLRIQSARDGELFEAPRQDSYRVPKTAPRVSAGQAVVCKIGPALWVPAQVLAVDGNTRTVVDAEGVRHQLRPLNVIAPTAVTQLNIERHLERAHQRRAFLRAAQAAGRPAAPKGWRPQATEAVVAERGGAWLSAHVRSVIDGGVQLSWDDGRPGTAVARDDLVPEPPSGYRISAGGFALLRDATLGPEWRPVRVVEEAPGGFRVQDSDGKPRVARPREMVPLEPPPAP